MFTVAEFIDPRVKSTPFATVDTIEAAEAFLADIFDVLFFERDDVDGGADAMVQPKGNKFAVPTQIVINKAR